VSSVKSVMNVASAGSSFQGLAVLNRHVINKLNNHYIKVVNIKNLAAPAARQCH